MRPRCLTRFCRIRLEPRARALSYLTDSSVSPLRRRLVDIADPYCTNVHHNLDEGAVSLLYVQVDCALALALIDATHSFSFVVRCFAQFDDVPRAKLPSIEQAFRAALEEVASTIGFDMTRMAHVIRVRPSQMLLLLLLLSSSLSSLTLSAQN